MIHNKKNHLKTNPQKYRFLSLALLVALVLLAVTFPVSAAKTFETDTQIELEPGIIEITQVPTFHFIGDIADLRRNEGGTLKGTIDGKLVLEDARGVDAGWSVYVSFGTFKNASAAGNRQSSSIGKPRITLGAPKITTEYSTETFQGYKTTMAAGDGVSYKVASAPPGTKGGAWSVEIPDASLSLTRAQSNLGTFQAKLNWSIQDTP